jgi:lia operon protein LiaF
LIGLLIIVFGIYFLLRNLNLVTVDLGNIVSTYWPVLLIIWTH